MKGTILIASLLVFLAFPLCADVRESGSAVSGQVTLNGLLPDEAICIFPTDGETGMPPHVTLVWYYGNDSRRVPTGFRIYRDTVLQTTVEYNGFGYYTHVFSGQDWGSTSQWQVVPTNAAGDCSTLYTWDFTVMEDPPTRRSSPPKWYIWA